MSQSLSNLSYSFPLTPRSTNNGSTAVRNLKFMRRNVTRAIAGENRDNLDHLQRTNSKQNLNKRPASAPAVSPLGIWDRFPTARTVQQMMDTMDRIMEDPLTYSSAWPSRQPSMAGVERSGLGRGRTPWEIKEGEKEYKLRFDMPGMRKEDVKVWVEEKMLVVKAEKSEKKEEEEEWEGESYGKYSGRIGLPENVDFEKIKAEVRDGVLYINIPKSSVRAKILDINVQ